MRRFKGRGRGRFSGSRRAERYWVPFFNADPNDYGGNGGEAGFIFTGLNVPVLAANITPVGGGGYDYATADTTLNFQNQQSKLLMLQGSIPIVSQFQGPVATWEDSGLTNSIPLHRMFYWWTKTRGDTVAGTSDDVTAAAQSSGLYVWSPGTANTGSLRRIMQRKDVISWGWRNIRPINPFNPRGGGDFYSFDQQYEPPNQQFIPMPRIPKKGYTFAPGESLRCYAVLVSHNFGGKIDLANQNTTAGLVDDVETSGYLVEGFTCFRGLFVK